MTQFPVWNNVLQGSVVNAITRKVFERKQGVQNEETYYITSFKTADHSVLFADSGTDVTNISYMDCSHDSSKEIEDDLKKTKAEFEWCKINNS